MNESSCNIVFFFYSKRHVFLAKKKKCSIRLATFPIITEVLQRLSRFDLSLHFLHRRGFAKLSNRSPEVYQFFFWLTTYVHPMFLTKGPSEWSSTCMQSQHHHFPFMYLSQPEPVCQLVNSQTYCYFAAIGIFKLRCRCISSTRALLLLYYIYI